MRGATGGQGTEVILERVGRDFLEKNLRCLAVFGRMAVYSAAGREQGTIVPAGLMKKCHAIVGFYLPRIMSRPDLFVPSLRTMLGWISSGDLMITISTCCSLVDAAVAHAVLEGCDTTGKIVLNPPAELRNNA